MRLLMLAAVLAAPAPPSPCLTQGDAEAVTLAALPEVIRQAGVACAGELPASSLLRRTDSAMLGRYDAEAERAWPAARGAAARLAGPSAEALLQSTFARPLLSTLIAPLIVGRIAAKDCGTLDRLVTALEPLPPRNTASALVTALRYLQASNADAARLPLCPTPK